VAGRKSVATYFKQSIKIIRMSMASEPGDWLADEQADWTRRYFWVFECIELYTCHREMLSIAQVIAVSIDGDPVDLPFSSWNPLEWG